MCFHTHLRSFNHCIHYNHLLLPPLLQHIKPIIKMFLSNVGHTTNVSSACKYCPLTVSPLHPLEYLLSLIIHRYWWWCDWHIMLSYTHTHFVINSAHRCYISVVPCLSLFLQNGNFHYINAFALKNSFNI